MRRNPAATVPRHSLQSLSAQLERVQAELDRLRTFSRSYDANSDADEVSAELIRAILDERRRRAAIFGRENFAYPRWDMLLELYARQLGEERATIGDLCRAVAIPSTTSLRWIGELERAGFLVRIRDKGDRRRTFVRLSESGLAAMDKFFREPLPVDIALQG